MQGHMTSRGWSQCTMAALTLRRAGRSAWRFCLQPAPRLASAANLTPRRLDAHLLRLPAPVAVSLSIIILAPELNALARSSAVTAHGVIIGL